MATANIKEALLREVSVLPSVYYVEVLDFIESLKGKRQPVIPETMLLSEAALSKDWDTEEENNAWASLNNATLFLPYFSEQNNLSSRRSPT